MIARRPARAAMRRRAPRANPVRAGDSRLTRYNGAMDPAALRSYVARDWNAIAAAKRAYWADRYRREGAPATMAASQALLREMREVRPDFPTPRDRRADLDAHVRLQALFERAAHAFTRR
jgi:hypothetical protein